ncbi:hypothetical protein V8C34DRAFT_289151 [Trichoderma compactum]
MAAADLHRRMPAAKYRYMHACRCGMRHAFMYVRALMRDICFFFFLILIHFICSRVDRGPACACMGRACTLSRDEASRVLEWWRIVWFSAVVAVVAFLVEGGFWGVSVPFALFFLFSCDVVVRNTMLASLLIKLMLFTKPVMKSDG